MSNAASIHTTPAADARLYWLHAITPLHVGSGRGIGFIDLPIMREVVTNWPLVPGSAVKGVLADYHDADEKNRNPGAAHIKGNAEAEKLARLRKQAFGRADDEQSNSNSGSLVFTDAHLVCLPVRSLYGTFAWCTCPLALERLRRDLDSTRCGAGLPKSEIPGPSQGELQAHLNIDPATALSDGAAKNARVFFEDLDFQSVPCASATAWAESLARWVFSDATWQKLFQERFAVVHDDVFSFLCETATQVDARVKISEDTKTVAEGQLWYEESLPAEAVLAGVGWGGPVFGNGNRKDDAKRTELVRAFCTNSCKLQIGGKATVGRGQVQMTFLANEQQPPDATTAGSDGGAA